MLGEAEPLYLALLQLLVYLLAVLSQLGQTLLQDLFGWRQKKDISETKPIL